MEDERGAARVARGVHRHLDARLSDGLDRDAKPRGVVSREHGRWVGRGRAELALGEADALGEGDLGYT